MRLTLLQSGRVEITATAEAASDTVSIEVEANPVSSLELQASVETARTGDVVRFTAIAKDARGLPVRGVPVQFGVGGQTAPDIIAAGAAAQIAEDGRFVAERSGTYTVVASTGSHSAARTVSPGSSDSKSRMVMRAASARMWLCDLKRSFKGSLSRVLSAQP